MKLPTMLPFTQVVVRGVALGGPQAIGNVNPERPGIPALFLAPLASPFSSD
jgi:hypothetical protein